MQVKKRAGETGTACGGAGRAGLRHGLRDSDWPLAPWPWCACVGGAGVRGWERAAITGTGAAWALRD